MIVTDEASVTAAVLAELDRCPDERFKEILGSLVRHLHMFIREARLSEEEFHRAIQYIAAIGQNTTESHNEGVLAAGSLGVSTLVCLLNNGRSGQTDTSANLLGPFWRDDAPSTSSGASIVRSTTPGDSLYVTAQFLEIQGNPIADARVDVWQSSPEGWYENQDPTQAPMNLRGRFTTNDRGTIDYYTVVPSGYPIPINGPVGDLLRIQHRHNLRPAHLHFMASKDKFKTLISQVYIRGDPHLETDVQFGVTEHLIADLVRHDDAKPGLSQPWYSLNYTFTLQPGQRKFPKPPISGKAQGTSKPVMPILQWE